MSHNNPYRDESIPGSEVQLPDTGPSFGPDGEIILPAHQTRGMIGHVSALGWLMMIQGFFELILGGLLIFIAMTIPQKLAAEVQNNPAVQNQAQPFTPDQLTFLVVAVCGGIGVFLIVIAILSIVGGIRIKQFRSYTFCLVAICAGFFSLFGGFYCFPTALCLGVYGLIVCLNDSVRRAFEIGRHGYTATQIRAAFADLPKSR